MSIKNVTDVGVMGMAEGIRSKEVGTQIVSIQGRTRPVIVVEDEKRKGLFLAKSEHSNAHSAM